MYSADFAQQVIAAFPDATLVVTPEKYVRDPQPQIQVPASRLHDLCKLLRGDARFLLDLPNHMTAVDYIKEGIFELVYFLYSSGHRQGLVVKTRVPRDQAEVDSVTDIWAGMDFQEREVFDLMGIHFRGHPNLKRIMMWEGFPGHPLRKDYVHVTDKYDSGLEVGTPGLDEKGLPIKLSSATPS